MSRRKDRENGYAGPFILHRLDMRQSIAWHHLPDNARRVLDRLEREHAEHGGARNGHLICTFDDFARAGIRRQSVALAIRECEALGFLQVTFHARPAVAEHRRGSEYRLTYVPGKSPSPPPTHDWRFIATETDAKAALDKAAALKSGDHVRRARQRTTGRTIRVVAA